MDLSNVKDIAIPEGEVIKVESRPVNLVKSYQDGYRFSSSQALKAQEGSVATGFIPCKTGSVVYMMGAEWGDSANINMFTYVMFYDRKKKYVSLINGDMEALGTLPEGIKITIGDDGVTIFDFTNWNQEFDFIRISAKGSGSSIFITVNKRPDLLLLWEVYKYTNWVPLSINADGTIYNDGLGYKYGYRVRSGGAEQSTINSAACTGFIPAKDGDIIRIYTDDDFLMSAAENAINVSDSNFTNLGQIAGNTEGGYGIFADIGLADYRFHKSVVQESDNVYRWVVPPNQNISYIRVTSRINNVSKFIVTVNEEIVQSNIPTLVIISAQYTGGSVPVGTALNDLTGITVKATYSDGSTSDVTGYSLSGTIAEGTNTITVTYEGKTVTFTVTGVAEHKYTNQVPVSIDTDGSVFNGKGYIGEKRLSSTGILKDAEYVSATGFIPASSGAKVGIKGTAWDSSSDYVCAYKSDFSFISALNGQGAYNGGTITRENDVTIVTLLNNSDIAYVRVSALHDSDDAGYSSVKTPKEGPGSYLIVTVNEEIIDWSTIGKMR